MVPVRRPWPPPETGAPVQPVENSVSQASCIQTAFVRYQPGLTCTGRPRLAIASLRGGAIRKEMLPHCVQPPGAWPSPRAGLCQPGSRPHTKPRPSRTAPPRHPAREPGRHAPARSPCLRALMPSLKTPVPSSVEDSLVRSGFPVLCVSICGCFPWAFWAALWRVPRCAHMRGAESFTLAQNSWEKTCLVKRQAAFCGAICQM